MATAAFSAPRSTLKNANYVHSACSAHIVSSLDLLQEPQRDEERAVQSVGGELIKLTHKGPRVKYRIGGVAGRNHGGYQQGCTYIYYIMFQLLPIFCADMVVNTPIKVYICFMCSTSYEDIYVSIFG